MLKAKTINKPNTNMSLKQSYTRTKNTHTHTYKTLQKSPEITFWYNTNKTQEKQNDSKQYTQGRAKLNGRLHLI